MSDLVVIVCPPVAQAEEVRRRLIELQRRYLLAVRNEDGKIKLDQLMNTTATGAISSGFWGSFLGVVFLNPLIGTALGASSGAGEFAGGAAGRVGLGR